jgi:hypothetical protein
MVPWFTKEQVLIQFRIKAALFMYKTAVSPATVDDVRHYYWKKFSYKVSTV